MMEDFLALETRCKVPAVWGKGRSRKRLLGFRLAKAEQNRPANSHSLRVRLTHFPQSHSLMGVSRI